MAITFERMIEIAESIKSPTIIDGHNGQEIDIAAIAVLSIGGERHHIVPLLSNTIHCLNAMNKADDTWTMSRWSVSGNVDTRDASIEAAIEVFNESYEEGDLFGDEHYLTLVKAF